MNQLPKWHQLPDLDLYLDQVLFYINQQTSSAISQKEKQLTAAMINNYVKHGYLPKPNKKKYTRRHLARLIVLTICKPIFPIAAIHAMIERLSQEEDSALLYDCFVRCFQGDSQDAPILIQKTCQTIHAYQETLALVQELEGEYHEL